MPPAMGQYAMSHTKKWASKVSEFDAYIFVTPEYNHSMPAALKSAIDYLYQEWNDKAARFVGYGSVGGARSIEQIRLVLGELKVADVRAQVSLSIYDDFENFSVFKPGDHQSVAAVAMLDDLEEWARALRTLRSIGKK